MPHTDARSRKTQATRSAAPAALGRRIAEGARSYCRWRNLPRLVQVAFHELDNHSPACTQSIIERLTAAIARERRRARTGHWSYDLNRHIALLQARRGEMRVLRDGAAPGAEHSARSPLADGAAQASATAAASSAAAPDSRTALLTGTNAS